METPLQILRDRRAKAADHLARFQALHATMTAASHTPGGAGTFVRRLLQLAGEEAGVAGTYAARVSRSAAELPQRIQDLTASVAALDAAIAILEATQLP